MGCIPWPKPHHKGKAVDFLLRGEDEVGVHTIKGFQVISKGSEDCY